MSVSFKGPGAKVVVAIGNEQQAGATLEAAVSLCRRTGMSLRLVHVVEPTFAGSFASHPFGDFVSMEALEKTHEEGLLAAESRLKELVHRTDVAGTTTNVVAGRPAEGVIADAIASRATLIMAGTGRAGHRFIFKGFSTAVSLMAQAPIPVLIVPTGVTLDFGREGLRFLLADDLREQSDGAGLAAFALAALCPRSELLHVHVDPLSGDHLIRLLGSTMNRLPRDARDIGPTDLLEQAHRHVEGQLAARAKGRREVLEAQGGRYQAAPLTGDAVEVLEQAIGKWCPDVIVFGRHQTIHRRPFLLGRIPFRAMLSAQRAVMGCRAKGSGTP
jgi:nucleotide-binding universal stress UspA family protein